MNMIIFSYRDAGEKPPMEIYINSKILFLTGSMQIPIQPEHFFLMKITGKFKGG